MITCAPNVPDGVVYDGYRNRVRAQEEVWEGVRVVRVWTYIAPNKGTVRRIANYVSFMFSATWKALFLPRPDVLIATSPQFFNGWAGVLTHWLRRIPFVLEIISYKWQKELAYLTDSFWSVFPQCRAREFARFIALAKKGEEFKIPEKRPQGGGGRKLEQAQQKFDLEQSIAYCRDVLGLGTGR